MHKRHDNGTKYNTISSSLFLSLFFCITNVQNWQHMVVMVVLNQIKKFVPTKHGIVYWSWNKMTTCAII